MKNWVTAVAVVAVVAVAFSAAAVRLGVENRDLRERVDELDLRVQRLELGTPNVMAVYVVELAGPATAKRASSKELAE